MRHPNRFTIRRLLVLTVFSVLLLWGTFALLENGIAARELPAAQKRWREVGLPVDGERLASLPAPDGPDEENFAATPALKGLVSEVIERAPGDRGKFRRLNALTQPRGHKGIGWSAGWNSCAGEEPDWVAWKAALERLPSGAPGFPELAGQRTVWRAPGTPRIPSEETIVGAARDVFRMLNSDPALIGELAEAARRRHARFVFHGTECPSEIEGVLKRTCVALGFQAQAALRSGAEEDAAKCAAVAARLAEAGAALEPGRAESMEWRQGALRCVADGIRDREWSEASLARLAPLWAVEEATEAPAIVWRTARAVVEFCDGNASDPEAAADLVFGSVWRRSSRLSSLAALIPAGYWRRNEAVSLNVIFDHALTPALTGGLQAVLDHEADCGAAAGMAAARPGRLGFPLHRHALVENAYGDPLRKLRRQAVERALFRRMVGRSLTLAVAVERFRLTEGRLPGTPAEVVPRFLPAVPDDLDGRPLRYVIKDGAFAVYSVALDWTDSWGGTLPAAEARVLARRKRESAKPWLRHGPFPEEAGSADWLFDFSPMSPTPAAR